MVTDTGNFARDVLREDALMEIARHCEETANILSGTSDGRKFRDVAESIFALYAD